MSKKGRRVREQRGRQDQTVQNLVIEQRGKYYENKCFGVNPTDLVFKFSLYFLQSFESHC